MITVSSGVRYITKDIQGNIKYCKEGKAQKDKGKVRDECACQGLGPYR